MSLLPRNPSAPLAAVALGLGLTGCIYVDATINGQEGVPLSELDMSGAAPVELLLAGGDNVILSEGDTLEIEVEGSDEAKAAVRFVLDGDLLGVTREEDLWEGYDRATVRVTMPAPREVSITGSGNVQADTLADVAQVSVLGSGDFSAAEAELSALDVNIGGSGTAEFGELATEILEINIGGSGSVAAAGSANRLEVSIGGSGGANLSDLKADDAEISIAGSGSVGLQSDGSVEANIMGSGSVSVKGDADCTENAMGSGSLRCSSS